MAEQEKNNKIAVSSAHSEAALGEVKAISEKKAKQKVEEQTMRVAVARADALAILGEKYIFSLFLFGLMKILSVRHKFKLQNPKRSYA